MKKNTAEITSKSIEQSGIPTDFRKAIAEYIWNGFDAKATRIDITFEEDEIHNLKSFAISDNGHGIDNRIINDTFGKFLDSQKASSLDQNGFVKGKKGKGRFSFSSFCNKAIWDTTYYNGENFIKYPIEIHRNPLEDYSTGKELVSTNTSTGTSIHFFDFYSLTGDLLDSKEFKNFLSCEFGWLLLLNKKNGFKITLNGIELDYHSVIELNQQHDITINDYFFEITFVRWTQKISEKYFYYFLNEDYDEKAREHTSFNNKSNGFHHSVYIKSNYFENFRITKLDNGVLEFEGKNQSDKTFKELKKQLNEIVTHAEKHFIREHKAEELITKYDSNNTLPKFKKNEYDQLRKKDLTDVIKELYCVQPKVFQNLNNTQSKTLVGFLNLLLDSEQRSNILEILESIINLQDDERIELAKVLERTKVAYIASLINMLYGRFEVINALKALVFDLEKFTNERDHIQKIIEENYWIFGEEYHMISADKNLEVSLNNYLSFVEGGKKEKEKINDKTKLKRPDLFIARQFHSQANNNEDSITENNIIVELKRPEIVIGKAQYDQIEEYIRFIIKEPRFISEIRQWKLILVGKSVDDWIKDKYDSNESKGKKFLIESVRNYEIYAYTWDDLFRLFDIRHKHLIDNLEFKSEILEKLDLSEGKEKENVSLIMENN